MQLVRNFFQICSEPTVLIPNLSKHSFIKKKKDNNAPVSQDTLYING